MSGIDLTHFHWLLTFMQAFGVAATIMVRLHHGTEDESSYQGLFYIGLLMAGFATAAQLATQTSSCVLSGMILATMVLAVTCDFSSRTAR